MLTILYIQNNIQVRRFVKLNEIYYAGSHGMDIEGPTNGNTYGEVRKQWKKSMEKINIFFLNDIYFLIIITE